MFKMREWMYKMREFADREAGRLTYKAKKVTAKAKSSLAAILALHDTIFFVPLGSETNIRLQRFSKIIH